jgi:chromosome segregation ATPase
MQRSQVLVTLVLSIGVCGAAFAQTQRSGGGEAQKFMQQYQQIAAEKSALQAQLIQSKKDLDAAQAELAAMKKERDELKARSGGATAQIAQLHAATEAADKNTDLYKQRMGELVERFRATATTLKDVEADRTQVRKNLETRASQLDKCMDQNAELFGLAGDILDHYEHIGLLTKVSASEPFTRITRTRLQNFADEYRERAAALQAKKRGS